MNGKSKDWKNIIILFVIIISVIIIFYLLEYFNIINPITAIQQFLITICIYILMLSITLFFVKKTSSFKIIGLNKENVLKNVGIGVLGSSGFLIASLLFGHTPIYQIQELLILLVLVILIGITEEIIFRGYIQAKLNKYYKSIFAILISSLFFALAHMPRMLFELGFLGIIGMISYTVIGLIFGYYKRFLNNLLGIIILHAFWDYWILIFVSINNIFSLPELELLNLLIYLLTAELLSFGLLLLGLFLSWKFIDHTEFDFYELKKILNNRLNKLEKKITSLNLKVEISPENQKYKFEIKLDEHLKNKFKEILDKLSIENIRELKNLYIYESKLKVLLFRYYFATPALKTIFERKIRYLKNKLKIENEEKFDLSKINDDFDLENI
ncbi:MAG: CPBP family intramembrane glutamic endopeptidase [Candidatus Helarchaeota archaeon]